MREWYMVMAAVGLLALGMAIGFVMAGGEDEDLHDTLFQVSTIDSLLLGGYDGDFTFRELREHGDFGTGTLDALDGEMTALDGSFYQVRADGGVYPISDDITTPFSSVTFFEPDYSFTIEGTYNYSEFIRLASQRMPSRDILYAIRMDVTAPYIKARAIPRQEKPYPALADAAANQSVFIINNTSGTIIGFYTPDSFRGLNIPGFHLHYIDTGRTRGGHILDFVLENATVVLDATPGFTLQLPPEELMPEPDSERNLSEDLEFVELGR
jgi:acetolactate decarboxylase